MIKDVPPVTRCVTAVVLSLTILTSLEIIQPYSLYFNLDLIIKKMQVDYNYIYNFYYFWLLIILTVQIYD
jgi:hypothetical protein